MAEEETAPPTVQSSSSLTQTFVEHYNNPYLFHHSDNTSLVLSDLLIDENYTSWSRAMVITFTVKNKIGFVDGSIPRPTGELLNSWIICDNIVISWILNSLSKEISTSALFFDSVHEIWLDLKERFQRQNRPRIFQLRRDLTNLVQDQLSVSSYFTRLKTLWTKLSSYRPSCSCGKCSCGDVKLLDEHFEQEYVMSFLMGLNDSYNQICAQLLLMEPAPTINRAFALVAQEMQQRANSHSSSAPPTVMMVRSSSQSSSTSQSYSSSGYQTKKKDKSVCTHCGIQGHTVDRCYKLHGYSPGYRFTGNRSTTSWHSTAKPADNPKPVTSSPAALGNSDVVTSLGSLNNAKGFWLFYRLISQKQRMELIQILVPLMLQVLVSVLRQIICPINGLLILVLQLMSVFLEICLSL